MGARNKPAYVVVIPGEEWHDVQGTWFDEEAAQEHADKITAYLAKLYKTTEFDPAYVQPLGAKRVRVGR